MLRIAVVVFLSLFVHQSVGAPAATGKPVPTERLREIMTFVAYEMGVETAHLPLPIIDYLKPRDLVFNILGEHAFLGTFLKLPQSEKQQQFDEARGYFSFSHNKMSLRNDVDYTDPREEYAVVHETVHYLQWAYHKRFVDPFFKTCLRLVEFQAYLIANKWVQLKGVGRTYDHATIHSRASCGLVDASPPKKHPFLGITMTTGGGNEGDPTIVDWTRPLGRVR